MGFDYKYLTNEEIEIVIEKFINILKERAIKTGTEIINAVDSLGRITSKPLYAQISNPNYYCSAMDGIAVKSCITKNASDTTPIILKEKTDYLRVDTGDVLPDGFDSIIMIEDLIEIDEGVVEIVKSVATWENVRHIGEDICKDEMIVPSKTKITSEIIGSALSTGAFKVEVFKKLVVGIIPTGDEIISPDRLPNEGEIIESNSYMIAAFMKEFDAIPKIYNIVRDKIEDIKKTVLMSSKECDLICIIAGSSAGRDDWSAKVIEESGELFFHGIAIKPGKPTILGIVNNKPIIGVPGYPVSAVTVIREIVKKIIDYIYFFNNDKKEKITCLFSKNIVSSLKYKEFINVRVGNIGGKYVAIPQNRGAGVITSLIKSDGVLTINKNCEGIKSGQTVDIILTRQREDIDNSLIISGSHDPLLDELSDLYGRNNKYLLSSIHIGSMGGIFSVKRMETHIGSIHLLDMDTGTYNTSYLKKYFDDGEVELIKFIKRTQGFIVKNGNSLNIKSVTDLTDKKIKFINRQTGSGTRILFDYFLSKNNIGRENINGYEKIETNHLGVAIQVKNGGADVGLGVSSAAEIYGLDFIPIFEEEYDFIIHKSLLNDEKIEIFLDLLKTDNLKKIVKKYNGYSLY